MKLLIERSTLDNIGSAIREKGGANDLIPVPELANSILNIPTGGGEIQTLEITGDARNVFAGTLSNGNTNYCSNYVLDNNFPVNFSNITNAFNLFYNQTSRNSLPNYKIPLTFANAEQMFRDNQNLKELNVQLTGTATSVGYMFYNCRQLREIPETLFQDLTLDNASCWSSYLFSGCWSLREIPQLIWDKLPRDSTTTASASIYYDGFSNCYALDKIVNLPVLQNTVRVPNFSSTALNNCFRLSDFTFETNDDGSPIIANWTGISINLSGVGICPLEWFITDYNSGITIDKRVNSTETYEALKNDPDWFATNANYSRYNHDSAVRTINSLPDCSSSGGTNTIKFSGDYGALTDGGAIRTLTEEEIAVATSKAWTVSLV